MFQSLKKVLGIGNTATPSDRYAEIQQTIYLLANHSHWGGLWYELPFGNIYFKYRNYCINGKSVRFATFANLEFKIKGDGILTALIEVFELNNYNVYFECVHNKRLALFLKKRGYIQDFENDYSGTSFYKLGGQQ